MLAGNGGGDIWNFVSALIGAVAVFVLALYKDNRTHKRIDSIEKWVSKMESETNVKIEKVNSVIAINADFVKEKYPNNEDLKLALVPIAMKMDAMNSGIQSLREIIDSEQKRKLEEQKEHIKRLEEKIERLA